MASREEIILGTAPNDRTGEPLRVGGDKINDNFIELFGRTNGNVRWISFGDLPNVAFTDTDETQPIYDALNARPLSIVPNNDIYMFATLRITATSSTTASVDKRFWVFRSNLDNLQDGTGSYYGQGSGITLSESNMKIFRFERYQLTIENGVVTGTRTNDLGVIGNTPTDLVNAINTTGTYDASNSFVLFSYNDGTEDRFAFYTGSTDNTIGVGATPVTIDDIRIVDVSDSDAVLSETSSSNQTASQLPILDINNNYTATNVEDALAEIKPLITGITHTSITNIDLKSNGTANQYVVEIEWIDSDGNAQTTTDPTPITITGGSTSTNTIEPLPDNAVRLLICTGQSNASGRGENSDALPSEIGVQSNVKIWVTGIINDWQDLNISTNNGSTGTQHGIELGLAQEFLANSPNETIYLVKHAVGGTNIDANSPSGTVYNTLNNDYLEPAINNLLADGKIPYVHFFFSQGEADSNSAAYLQYSQKLQSLMNHYESKLGTNVHFIFPEILELGANTNESNINDIFNSYSVIKPNVTTVQSKAYSAQDLQHWNYDGYKLIAKDIYRAMVYKTGSYVYNDITNFLANEKKYLEGVYNFSSTTIEDFPESALPAKVVPVEITAADEIELRSYSPSDILSFINTHSSSSNTVTIQNTSIGKEYSWIPYGDGFGTVGTSNPLLIGTGSNVSGNFSSIEVQARWNARQQSGLECGAREASPFVTSLGSGFYFQTQIRCTPSSTGNIEFYGLNGSSTAIGNIDPSTLDNVIGVSLDSSDSNYQFIHSDDSSTTTKIDLGASFVRGNMTLQIELYNPTGDSNVQYRVVDLEAGSDTGFIELTTNLPLITQGLTPHLYMNIGTGNGSNSLKINHLKILKYS